MALNVNWNWRMPTVGDPNGPANSNLAGLQQGVNAVAQGIQRAKERENAEKWRERDYEQKLAEFQYGKEKDQMANAMKNRDYWEQKRLNDEKIKQAEAELEQKKQQQEWMNKMYNEYFGDINPELKALREKYGNTGAALVMNGLNPVFMK